MFSFTLKAHTEFDKTWIKRDWRRMNRGPLGKVGNLLRSDMRQSIRRARYGARPNPAGKTPKSRDRGKNPRFKMFRFNVSTWQTNVITGLIRLYQNGTPVPGAHELGLYVTRKLRKHVPSKRTRLQKDAWAKLPYAVKKRIRKQMTARMARKTFKLPQRPFARPSLQRNLHKISQKHSKKP